MIEINKDKLLMWRRYTIDGEYGCMTKVVKLSGLSHPTILRAVKDGRATPKTAEAIDKAVSKVRKQIESVIKM